MSILRGLRDKDMQRSTWITHALGTLVFQLVAHFAWGQLVAAGWTAVVFFIAKEQLDKRMHLRKGDYDTPDASGVAPRSDHVGDLLGPICLAVGATLGTWLG